MERTAGSSYFCERFFRASCSKNQQKITRPPMPSAAPIRPRHLVSTQQGVETQVPNDLTPFRKAYIFSTIHFLKTNALRLSATKNLHFASAPLLSRPLDLNLQPLAEQYVNLSIHTAPIRKTHLSFLIANGRTSLDIDLQSSQETVLLLFYAC